MSSNLGPPGSKCLFCGISTARRRGGRRPRPQIRSYELCEGYLYHHPHVQEYANHIFHGPRQIAPTDRICQRCTIRASRYSAERARAAAATDHMFVPSSSHGSSASSSVSDPLRDSARNSPQPAVQIASPRTESPDNIQVPPVEEIQDAPNAILQDDIADAVQEAPQEIPAPITFPVPGFSRVSSSSALCFVSGCNVRDSLHRISVEIRTNVLMKLSIYIPPTVRVCHEHLNSSEVWLNFADYCRPRHDTFNPTQVANMLVLLQKQNKFLDFDNLDSIDDATFQYFIGLNKSDFLEIIQNTPSLRRFKKPNRALAMVLCKLHQGDCNERLSKLFRISPQHLGRMMRKVRTHLLREFVPLHLGLSTANNHEELQQRILAIPDFLYSSSEHPNGIIVICDGTYVYIQKSSNYSFQKKSYSLHKYRNLLKMFMVVSPDGHILDAFGPFAANKSDAIIMRELLESNEFRSFFQRGDVLILDRGFRDVMGELRALRLRAYMPITRNTNDRQLTTQQANESRKVTICRWVVEAVNGHLKNQFRQLRQQYSNVAARNMKEEFKIACALLNAFGARFTNHALVNEILNEINEKQNTVNTLSDIVNQNNRRLNRLTAVFERMNAIQGLDDFPVLTMNDLIIMAVGTYQIAQARSYYGEHIKNGTYTIEICRENRLHILPADCWLLRAKIHSRHAGQRVYLVYILIQNNMEGRRAIAGHYCTCIEGNRTLGCCSHVMSVVWFMSWARHQETLPLAPAAFLDSIIVRHDIENEANDEF